MFAHLFAVQRSHIKEWDIAETQGKGPFPEILEYDIFVNCILLSEVFRLQNILLVLLYGGKYGMKTKFSKTIK